MEEKTKIKQRKKTAIQENLYSDFYKNFLDMADELIVCWDVKHYFVYTNPQFQTVLGYSDKKIAQINFKDILAVDYLSDWQKTMDNLTKDSPIIKNYKTAFVSAEGKKIIVSGNLSAHKVASRVIAYQGIFRNISETEQTAAKLRIMNQDLEKRRFELEALKSLSDRLTNIFTIPEAIRSLNSYLSEILDFSAATYLITKTDGQGGYFYKTFANEKISKNFIASVKNDIDKYLRAKKNPALDKLITHTKKHSPQIIDQGAKIGGEAKLRSKIIFPLDVGRHSVGLIHIASKKTGLYKNGTPWISDSMIVTFILFVVRMQTFYQAQRSRTESLIESLSDGFIMFNEKMQITLMNPASIDYIGLLEKPFIMKSFFNLFPELDLQARAAEMLLKKTTIHIEEAQYKGRFFQIYLTPIKDNQNKIVSGAIVMHDITHLKEIERIKTEFVSIASHQLRTPLTGIKWFTRLLVKDDNENLTDRQKDFISQIHDSTQRMIKLVKDLLDVSHFETGRKFEIVKIPTTIKKLIDNTYQDCAVLGAKRKIKLSIIAGKNCGTQIKADSGKIRQAFNNLVNNAIKYSPAGGKVAIGAKIIPKKEVIFYVKDQGLGIPEAQQPRMFEKFFRADNVKVKETKGSGLGLYIAKAIFNAHNGKIWFKSKENKGTTFYFSLPLTK